MDRDRVRKSIGSGNLIGAMVYWTALSDVRTPRALFRQGIRACGLEDALAAEPKPEKVLNLAVGVANRRQGGAASNKTAPGYAKLKDKTDAVVTYAVFMRRDLTDRGRYLEEATVSIDRTAPNPSPVVTLTKGAPKDEARDNLITRIVDQYTELSSFSDTQEVSKTLVASVRDVCSGLTLKAGFYLVRPDYLLKLRALRDFMATDLGATLEIWEIGETVDNTKTAKRSASESLRAAVDELIANAREFAAENTDPDDVSTKSINAQMRRFRDLDAKVTLYADILADYSTDLHKAIADAKQSILGKYLGDVEDDAAAPVAVAS